jgi:hypothetical protein
MRSNDKPRPSDEYLASVQPPPSPKTKTHKDEENYGLFGQPKIFIKESSPSGEYYKEVTNKQLAEMPYKREFKGLD